MSPERYNYSSEPYKSCNIYRTVNYNNYQTFRKTEDIENLKRKH
jgi:hypothetical protein